MASRTKPYYTEIDAAKSFGISIEAFRGLVKRHIIGREEEMPDSSMATFHAADLLILRMFAGLSLAHYNRK